MCCAVLRCVCGYCIIRTTIIRYDQALEPLDAFTPITYVAFKCICFAEYPLTIVVRVLLAAVPNNCCTYFGCTVVQVCCGNKEVGSRSNMILALYTPHNRTTSTSKYLRCLWCRKKNPAHGRIVCGFFQYTRSGRL